MSKYHFDAIMAAFFFITIPFLIINCILSFMGMEILFPAVNAAMLAIIVVSVIITCKICKKRIIFDKKIIVYGAVFAVISGIAAFQFYDRNTKVLSYEYGVETIKDEVRLYDYHPFYENSLLKKLNEPAAISFTENYPKLDGATAAYPVYAAMVQELYKGLNGNTVNEYIACSNTAFGYDRLIDGEIDIFFGAQPSRQQVGTATEAGVEFVLTPVAKEAFVFFVHKDNPVSSLTLEQIQNIYAKKIINWHNLGGKAEKIVPFQRPENSGSQTIMLARVMGDKPLPPPLWEEYGTGMGETISRVAQYRNYSSAIGYSFRYFATGMSPSENIKLIAINGIEPSVENIINGSYPFTIDVYAVTAGSKNENTEKLILWILSEQGQGFVEECGYVRLNP